MAMARQLTCALLLAALAPAGALAAHGSPRARLGARRAAPRASSAPPSSDVRAAADALAAEAETAALTAERASLEVERLKLGRAKQRAQAEAERLGLTSAEAIAAARSRAAAEAAEQAAVEAAAREAAQILAQAQAELSAEGAAGGAAAASAVAPPTSVWGRMGEQLAGGRPGEPAADGEAPQRRGPRRVTPYGVDPALDAATLALLRERVLAPSDAVLVKGAAKTGAQIGPYFCVELKKRTAGAPSAAFATPPAGAGGSGGGADPLAKLRDVLPAVTPAIEKRVGLGGTVGAPNAGGVTDDEARAAGALADLQAALDGSGPELAGKVRLFLTREPEPPVEELAQAADTTDLADLLGERSLIVLAVAANCSDSIFNVGPAQLLLPPLAALATSLTAYSYAFSAFLLQPGFAAQLGLLSQVRAAPRGRRRPGRPDVARGALTPRHSHPSARAPPYAPQPQPAGPANDELVSQLLERALPVAFCLVALQLAHDAGHQLAASKRGVRLGPPTLVPRCGADAARVRSLLRNMLLHAPLASRGRACAPRGRSSG